MRIRTFMQALGKRDRDRKCVSPTRNAWGLETMLMWCLRRSSDHFCHRTQDSTARHILLACQSLNKHHVVDHTYFYYDANTYIDRRCEKVSERSGINAYEKASEEFN